MLVGVDGRIERRRAEHAVPGRSGVGSSGMSLRGLVSEVAPLPDRPGRTRSEMLLVRSTAIPVWSWRAGDRRLHRGKAARSQGVSGGSPEGPPGDSGDHAGSRAMLARPVGSPVKEVARPERIRRSGCRFGEGERVNTTTGLKRRARSRRIGAGRWFSALARILASEPVSIFADARRFDDCSCASQDPAGLPTEAKTSADVFTH